jgi:peptidoglycan L-alanyl-D-glutamate endopeptidase CwlK
VDSVSEQRLLQVAPGLARLIRQLAASLAAESVYVRVVQGMRSWDAQNVLYAQGRSVPGSIVTNVQGGYSYHNFGMAVDLVPSEFAPDQPYNPDWNPQHPTWKTMETAGVALGLDSGAEWRTFPDAPHFQLTNQFPEAEPSDEVRQLFTDGGMQTVWEAAGINT